MFLVLKILRWDLVILYKFKFCFDKFLVWVSRGGIFKFQAKFQPEFVASKSQLKIPPNEVSFPNFYQHHHTWY